MKQGLIPVLAGAAASVLLAGCVSDGGGPPESANSSRGPIEIWLSTNPEEVAWGEEVVASWNSQHPDEKITAQQIPAGKTSEEVIYSSIVAGNAPCVVMNTAPSAVPQFEKAGGLVPVDTFPDGDSYIDERTGKQVADQYRSPDGRFYQIPWKVNPVMIFYNKELFAEAGLDPENPPLKTWAEFLRDLPDARGEGRGARCDLAGTVERVLPVLVRLLPAVRRADPAAARRGRQGDVRLPRRSGGRTVLADHVRGEARPAGEVQR